MPQPKRQADEIREAGAPDAAAVEEGLPSQADRREARDQARRREPRFTTARLRAAPEILGQPAHVVAGALAVADLDEDDELTRAQAERHVERFLDHTVQTDTEEG